MAGIISLAKAVHWAHDSHIVWRPGDPLGALAARGSRGGIRLDAILLGASVSACEKGRKWEQALSVLAQATKLESCDFMGA